MADELEVKDKEEKEEDARITELIDALKNSNSSRSHPSKQQQQEDKAMVGKRRREVRSNFLAVSRSL
jgi:non-homologous end joining protein Ku